MLCLILSIFLSLTNKISVLLVHFPHKRYFKSCNARCATRKNWWFFMICCACHLTWKGCSNLEWWIDLPDGSYPIADIQDYFEFIIKKHKTLTENPPVQIYANKIQNRIVFKVKTGYKVELLSSGTMKLLGTTSKDVD